MATLKGKLLYKDNRVDDQTGVGMGGIPMVLQNLSTGITVAVNTNSDGSYTFTDVPDGNYQVVEKADWFPKPGATGTGSYTQYGEKKPIITDGGVTPLVNSDPNQPNRAVWNSNVKGGSTNTDGVSATTVKFNLTGNTVTSTWQGNGQTDPNKKNYRDTNGNIRAIANGPVRYVPFSSATQNDAKGLKENLFKDFGNGTFGTFDQGTPPESYATPKPYDDSGSAFNYSSNDINPPTSTYVVRNSKITDNNWHRLSGHTTGNEMDRYMAVNGGLQNENVISKTVDVQPNSKYLFSAWVANLTRDATWIEYTGHGNFTHTWSLPAVKLTVTDENGTVLYDNDLGKALQNTSAKHLGYANVGSGRRRYYNHA